MLYVFPPGTRVVALRRYERPYSDPIHVVTGEFVEIDRKQSASTDLFGWLWCCGPDGRKGWTPEAWLEQDGDRARIMRDFSALELNVEKGERLIALFSESGFIFARRSNGEEGWVPDGLIDLERD
jgi:hypothetical protein